MMVSLQSLLTLPTAVDAVVVVQLSTHRRCVLADFHPKASKGLMVVILDGSKLSISCPSDVNSGQ